MVAQELLEEHEGLLLASRMSCAAIKSSHNDFLLQVLVLDEVSMIQARLPLLLAHSLLTPRRPSIWIGSISTCAIFASGLMSPSEESNSYSLVIFFRSTNAHFIRSSIPHMCLPAAAGRHIQPPQSRESNARAQDIGQACIAGRDLRVHSR
jgi:hypothetical protein